MPLQSAASGPGSASPQAQHAKRGPFSLRETGPLRSAPVFLAVTLRPGRSSEVPGPFTVLSQDRQVVYGLRHPALRIPGYFVNLHNGPEYAEPVSRTQRPDGN